MLSNLAFVWTRRVDTFLHLGLLCKHCNLLHIKETLLGFSHFSSDGYASLCCPASISKWPSCSFGSSSLSANNLNCSGIFTWVTLEPVPRSDYLVKSFKIQCRLYLATLNDLLPSNIASKSFHPPTLGHSLSHCRDLEWFIDDVRGGSSQPFRVTRYKRA